MAESRDKLVYIVLDELNRPISLGGMEDGDFVSDSVLPEGVRDVCSVVIDTSGDWTSVYTTVEAASGIWDIGGGTPIDIADWEQVSTVVVDSSGDWDNTFTKVDAASGDWDGAYASALTASAVISDNRLVWESGGSPSATGFEDWNNAFNKVDSTSDGWDGTYTSVNGASGTWDGTYTSVNGASGTWDGVYASVNPVSGTWDEAATILDTSDANFLGGLTPTLSNDLTINDGIQIEGLGVLSLSSQGNLSLSSGGSIFVSSTNKIDINPNANVNLIPTTGNVRLVPDVGNIQIKSVDSVFLSGVGVSCISNDGNFTIGTNADNQEFALKDTLNDAISTKSTVDANSANWINAFTKVDSASDGWDGTYTSVNGASGTWDNAFTKVDSASDGWDGTYTSVNGASGTWDGTYTSVNGASGTWDAAYSSDLFPSAAGFDGWNSTKSTVDADSANWDAAYTAINDNADTWTSTFNTTLNTSATWASSVASSIGCYIGSSVAISGFGDGDTDFTPGNNQYLALNTKEERMTWRYPRFIQSANQLLVETIPEVEDLPNVESLGMDVGLSLSGWFQQTEYDITTTLGLPDNYSIDIDFDQSQQQTANLTAVSANGSTLGLNFSNIAPGRRVNLTLINPTYTITTIPLTAGATWMTTPLSKMGIGEVVEVIIYSRGSTASDLYLYSTQIESDEVVNESGVAGATVTDALDQLSSDIVTDHGALTGLSDDDHPQYVLNSTNLELSSAFESVSSTVFDNSGSWGGGGGVTDHGALTGLSDDDHTQYHNDTRADTWLATKGSDNLDNDSGVAGATVTAALDQLDSDIAAKRDAASYIARQNSATQDLNGTNVAANWGQAVASNGSDLSWDVANPSRISIATTGDYRVTFNLAATSTAVRSNIIARLRVNGTTFRGPIGSSGYIRSSSSHDNASVHAAFIHPFTAGDYIEIVANREAAAGNWTTVNGACSISLEKL
jgi:hypothetical protein